MPQIITDIFDFGSFCCHLLWSATSVQIFQVTATIHYFRSFKFKNNLAFDKYAM